MAATQVVGVDQSVRSLGPSGEPYRRRYSQADAQALAARGQVYANWNRLGTRIRTIQFFPRDGGNPSAPQRWLKTGTRYSFTEKVGDYECWTHKALPHRAVDAQLGYVEPNEVIQSHIRALYMAVPLSIVAAAERKRATVISIQAARGTRPRKPAAIAFPEQLAA